MNLRFRRLFNRLTDRRREPPLIFFVVIAAPMPFVIFVIDKPFVIGLIFLAVGLLFLGVFLYLSRVAELNKGKKREA